MFTMILLAAFAQPDVQPLPNQTAGLPPDQAVASIDSKGVLSIAKVRPVCGHGMRDHEVWLKTPEKKPGEKVSVKAKVTQMMVTVVELPSHVVEAYTVDGKLIPPAKLTELLAKERTVLVAMDGKKVDPFHLQLYKQDTIVLVAPGNLWGVMDSGPHGEFGPIRPPLEKRDDPPLPKRNFEKTE